MVTRLATAAPGLLVYRLAWRGLSVHYHDANDLVTAMARTVIYLYAAGAALVLLSLPLVDGTDADLVAIGLIATAALAAAALHLVLFDRVPLRAFQGSGFFATALVTAAILFAGELGTTYALFYFWVVLYAFFFYELAAASVQLAAIAVAFAVLLLLAGESVGPVHAIVMVATLAVAGLIVLFVKYSLLRVIESLEVSEARVRELFENADDIAYTLGLDARFTSVNRALERMTGYTRDELIGRPMTDLVPPALAAYGLGQLRRKLDAPDVVTRYECTLVAKSGEEILVEIVSRIVAGADGRPVGVQGIARDVRERNEFERELAAAEQRFRSLVQNASDVISVVDADTTIRYQTPGVAGVLGYAAEELVGTRLVELVHPDHRDALTALCSAEADPVRSSNRRELRFRRKDGRWRYLDVVARNELEDEAIAGVVLTGHDVTARKRLERKLQEQAFRDPLTGLANRAHFHDRLGEALARRRRHGGDVAVLFLDLDDFKTVNDSLGHDAGDRLLVETAERLRGSTRRPDATARLGGDEFAVLVERVGSRGVSAVAERILAAFDAPYRVEGVELSIAPSIGIAVAEEGEEVDAAEVLRQADVAMYRAKVDATRRYEVFEPEMHAAVLKRLELKGRLERALERDEFELHYQPIVAVADGTLAGVEALVRWRDPRAGLVPPLEFVPLMEESGLVVPLGDVVLRSAARQARAWQRQYGVDGLPMRVNLSARQLQQPDIVDRVAAALAEAGLPASSLILEITETVLMSDADETIARLEHLRALGIGLALDDFGTGFSSLSYLRDLPLQELKLAKKFVLNMADESDEAIVRSTVQLGRNLGLRVLAEGVEDEAIWRAVQALGCDLAQGYHVGGPVPASELDPRRAPERGPVAGRIGAATRAFAA